jgi:hypothetical protein
MAKTTAWLMTLVGLVWIGQILGYTLLGYSNWIIGLAFLAIGVTKLIRAYGSYGGRRARRRRR